MDMRILRVLSVLVLAAGVSACVKPEAATRAAPVPSEVTKASAGGGRPGIGIQTVNVPLHVVDVRVTVPRDLKVSEAETWYPIADIVWRGDARGTRYEQIEAIYAAAIPPAIAPLTRGIPVVAEIEVTRFHCVTDKTRYTVGGVHSLKFLLTIRHAETGEILAGPRPVNADAPAPGGQRAVAQDMAGITQKQVVTERLATVIRRELKTLNIDPALLGLPASQGVLDPALLAD
jgi:hypothetical protein